jgi:hypothetical protein
MRAYLVFALLSLAAGATPVVTVGLTKLHICSDKIIRVTKTPTAEFPKRVELIAKTDWDTVAFTKSETADAVSVSTKFITATVSKATGLVSFADATTDQQMLTETNFSFTPTVDMHVETFVIEQSWSNDGDDGFYGGGEYQNGIVNFKNAPIQMVQFNTEAVVPFFASTKGYGILWDNYAWTYLNPSTDEIKMTPVLDIVLPNGSPIRLVACNADMTQQWKLDPSDKRLKLYNEDSHTKVLDADIGAGTKVVHLWTEDSRFDGNQQWELDGKLLKNSHSALCLKTKAAKSMSELEVVACDATDVLQQWQLDAASGHLTNGAGAVEKRIAERGLFEERANGDNSVLCLAALKSAPAPPNSMATFTPTVDGVHHFYVDACPGPMSTTPGASFGCGSGKTVHLWMKGMEGEPILDWDQLTNMPNSMTGRATLKAGTALVCTGTKSKLTRHPHPTHPCMHPHPRIHAPHPFTHPLPCT